MRKRSKKKIMGSMVLLLLLLGLCSACKEETGKDISENATLTPEVGEVSGEQSTPEQVVGNDGTYKEAPLLQAMVKMGELPEVQKRLPVSDAVYVASYVTEGTYGDDVQFAVENANKLTGELVSEGLFQYSDTGTIAPNIATHYTVNSDFTKYTIYLREGMRWSDGVLFTADDCVFFYEKICLPEVFGEPLWECFKVYDAQGKLQKASFRKLDTYCFEVIFPQSKPEFFAQLLKQGGICFAPEHYFVNLMPEFMGEDAAKAKAKHLGYSDVNEMLRQTVLNGWNAQGVPTLNPYVISREDGKNDVNGDYYEFVRNPYYWKADGKGQQLPYMDRLGFTRISGENQKMMLTTEGFLSVSELSQVQVTEARANEKRGNYRIITWMSDLSYAVRNGLKNFPENCPYEEVLRGMGAAHPEYWYME